MTAAAWCTSRGKVAGGARLVVVLEEAREVVLVVEAGAQVLADAARVPRAARSYRRLS